MPPGSTIPPGSPSGSGAAAMSSPHATSGELIEVLPQGARLRELHSETLVRADHLEVFRFVLPAGKTTPEHRASGAITLHCLGGAIELAAHGRRQILHPGNLVYLSDGEPHAVCAQEDSVLLVTVLLRRA